MKHFTALCLCILGLPVFWRSNGQAPKKLSKPNTFSLPVVPIHNDVKDFISDKPFFFTDQRGRLWYAPPETRTDGASIPQGFLSFTGQPFKKQFIGAALVHDAYCGDDNSKGASYHKASWRAVHRMFYEGLLVGGTSKPLAMAMYAAVWIGGPHNWVCLDKEEHQYATEQLIKIYISQDLERFTRLRTTGATKAEAQQYLLEEQKSIDVSTVADSVKRRQMRVFSAFINNQNPTIDELEEELKSSLVSLHRNVVYTPFK